MLFERLAIDGMQEAGRSAVARRMGISWDQADRIMQRAVTRGLARRKQEVVPHLGVDEKSFQKRHEYVTLVCDLEKGHVLYVGDDRKRETLDAFYESLSQTQRQGIEAVAMDMWEYRRLGVAKRFFHRWYNWAIRSRLEPMKKVARMLKRRLVNVLTYIGHRITNAQSESLNSKIQWIKYTAHGFRSRKGFRRAIYFHCGGLALYPKPKNLPTN